MAECMHDTVGNHLRPACKARGDKIFPNFIDETCTCLAVSLLQLYLSYPYLDYPDELLTTTSTHMYYQQ